MNYIIKDSELTRLLMTFYELQALRNYGGINWSRYDSALQRWENFYGTMESMAQDELKSFRKVDEN